MFEQTFKNIDDILYKDSGADSELDYIGQTSWVLFLRYLYDLEQDKADDAALQGKPYKFIIEDQFRWTVFLSKRGFHNLYFNINFLSVKPRSYTPFKYYKSNLQIFRPLL